MKRMWRTLLTTLALAAVTGTAQAQDAFSQPAAIGSYQSILSRAGYGDAAGSATRAAASANQAISQPGGFGTLVQDAAGSGMQHGMQQVQGSFGNNAPPQPTMMSQSPMVGSSTMSMAPANPVMTGPVSQAPVMSSPVMSAPMPSAPMMTGGVVGGSSCTSCNSASSLYGGTPTYSAPVQYSAPVSYAAPTFAAPVVYQPVVAPVVTQPRSRANYSGGIYGLNFTRDYEDDVILARNTAGEKLFTTDADEQNFDGYGVSVASRRSNGRGYALEYWALNPGVAAASITGGNVATERRGLDQLVHTSSGRDLEDVYSNTLTQTVIRDTDINNIEFNLLQNAGTFCTKRQRNGFYELLGGFRYFDFEESLQYQAFIDNTAFPLVPEFFSHNISARNRLLGLQIGARNELCLGSKLRLFSGVKGGLFNNFVQTRQNITDANGELAVVSGGPADGRNFDYRDDKNDLAFLGELDFGVLYQLSCRSRIRLGYRVLGVSGVALAADQITNRVNDPDTLLNANSNGSLLLGGGYYGLEFCF